MAVAAHGLWAVAGTLLALGAAAALLDTRLAHRGGAPRRAAAWLWLAAAMGAALAFASSSAGSADPMLRWLTGLGISEEAAYAVTVATRKTVHFTYFGLLALAAYRASQGLAGEKPGRPLLFAALYAAMWAAFDEASQLASPERTASALDFGLDLLGAGTFLALARRQKATPHRRDRTK
jgi:hypothetical protein